MVQFRAIDPVSLSTRSLICGGWGRTTRLHVDREADALYLRLDDSKIIESQEVFPGVVLDCNAANQVVGVEILRVSSRTPRPELGKLTSKTTPVRTAK